MKTKFTVIQRPQTIFLSLAAILNLAVFFTPIYRHAVNDPAAWIGSGFAIALTASMILALFSIFLYKNRPNQLKWVKIGTYVQITALGFAAGVLFSMGGFGTFLWREVASSGLILLSLILFWQAGRFVKRDEELVKSMDRIR
ncbi:MAG: DUF4293 domain-containing protein [Balneolaceae bacterium]|nr:DUF4293 domain-containing protein [Balneolaceae bacterium]